MQTIRLGNTEFEGRNNAYLLCEGDATTLIDTGVATEAVQQQLEQGLAEVDRSFESIDLVVLTHWHPDHAGLAGAIQAAGGARVLVHDADAPLVRQDEGALAAMRQTVLDRFEGWGLPRTKREEALDRLDAGNALGGLPVDPETITDGEVIDVGATSLTVGHAPGHTAGLSWFGFVGESGQEAFVGDAVLPVYTPNVGGADVRVDKPLKQYVETLERIESADFERVHPGHRDVIEHPSNRAREIIDHHRTRTGRIVEVLRKHGPIDAWTVSAHLFGDLEGIHILHGPGEAYAHLDHLEHHGVVENTAAGYRLLEDDPSLEALI